MEAERRTFADTEERMVIPAYIKEIIAEFTALARRHPEINQRSGVSVRVSIANYETVIANALRRALMSHEPKAAPRITDLPFMVASTVGKIELETMEEEREGKVIEELVKKAVLNVFDRYFSPSDFDQLVVAFETGSTIETSAGMPSADYVKTLAKFDGFRDALKKLKVGEDPAVIASAMEFIVEGLHLNRKLNRDSVDGLNRYHV